MKDLKTVRKKKTKKDEKRVDKTLFKRFVKIKIKLGEKT